MGRRPQPGGAGWRAARRRPAEHASAAHLDDAHVVRGSTAASAAAAAVSTPPLTATIAAATIATAAFATFMPPVAFTATSVPRWRHHPMHKHVLSLKQRPVQRRWLWFSSPSAGRLPRHLQCKLLQLWLLLPVLLRELMAWLFLRLLLLRRQLRILLRLLLPDHQQRRL